MKYRAVCNIRCESRVTCLCQPRRTSVPTIIAKFNWLTSRDGDRWTSAEMELWLVHSLSPSSFIHVAINSKASSCGSTVDYNVPRRNFSTPRRRKKKEKKRKEMKEKNASESISVDQQFHDRESASRTGPPTISDISIGWHNSLTTMKWNCTNSKTMVYMFYFLRWNYYLALQQCITLCYRISSIAGNFFNILLLFFFFLCFWGKANDANEFW